MVIQTCPEARDIICKVLFDDRVREMPRRRSKVVMTSDEDLDDEDSQERPQQRNAANARERARMRVLSRAFCRLKTTLPWVSMRSWYDQQYNTHQTSLPLFRGNCTGWQRQSRN